jgi:hypothetical protein
MIEVQISDLAGAALDWAVAKVEEVSVLIAAPHYGTDWRVYKPGFGGKYSPSKNWTVGGPILEKYQISLHSPQHDNDCWAAWLTIDGKEYVQGGENALSAACRAVVAAKQGTSVAVPQELFLQVASSKAR